MIFYDINVQKSRYFARNIGYFVPLSILKLEIVFLKFINNTLENT